VQQLAAFFLQNSGEQPAVDVVVIDDQDPRREAGRVGL
jgi:hypothetical protein